MFDVHTGYGSVSEYTVRALARAGARVHVIPVTLRPRGLSKEFWRILESGEEDIDAPVLVQSWLRPEFRHLESAPGLFIYTMWESSRLPSGWADQLSRATAIVVPSSYVAGTFRENGVSVPVMVVPEGVDPAVYRWVERPRRRQLTTLIVGPLDERKHVAEGVAAWHRAFSGDPHARLIIKTTYNYQNYAPTDPRIRYVDQVETTRGIPHWYEQADVLLALGNEGYGAPLIEAMATGLPVIALDSEGQADACREAAGMLLPVKPVRFDPYVHPQWGDCGIRATPGVDDVAERLRWVATHRDEATAMGRAAAQWAAVHRNVWARGPALLDIMARSLAGRGQGQGHG